MMATAIQDTNVVFIVSGRRFDCALSILSRQWPECQWTLLAQQAVRQSSSSSSSSLSTVAAASSAAAPVKEVTVKYDRDSDMFAILYDFLQTSDLHIPKSDSERALLYRNALFYGIVPAVERLHPLAIVRTNVTMPTIVTPPTQHVDDMPKVSGDSSSVAATTVAASSTTEDILGLDDENDEPRFLEIKISYCPCGRMKPCPCGQDPSYKTFMKYAYCPCGRKYPCPCGAQINQSENATTVTPPSRWVRDQVADMQLITKGDKRSGFEFSVPKEMYQSYPPTAQDAALRRADTEMLAAETAARTAVMQADLDAIQRWAKTHVHVFSPLDSTSTKSNSVMCPVQDVTRTDVYPFLHAPIQSQSTMASYETDVKTWKTRFQALTFDMLGDLSDLPVIVAGGAVLSCMMQWPNETRDKRCWTAVHGDSILRDYANKPHAKKQMETIFRNTQVALVQLQKKDRKTRRFSTKTGDQLSSSSSSSPSASAPSIASSSSMSDILRLIRNSIATMTVHGTAAELTSKPRRSVSPVTIRKLQETKVKALEKQVRELRRLMSPSTSTSTSSSSAAAATSTSGVAATDVESSVKHDKKTKKTSADPIALDPIMEETIERVLWMHGLAVHAEDRDRAKDSSRILRWHTSFMYNRPEFMSVIPLKTDVVNVSSSASSSSQIMNQESGEEDDNDDQEEEEVDASPAENDGEYAEPGRRRPRTRSSSRTRRAPPTYRERQLERARRRQEISSVLMKSLETAEKEQAKEKVVKIETKSLVGLSAWRSTDIDLFLVTQDPVEATRAILAIYTRLRLALPRGDVNITCIRSQNAVTFVMPHPFRSVQIILRLYESASQVLLGFDIDCCAVAFDAKHDQLLISDRAMRAIVNRYNLVDRSRMSTTYEYRLAKYARRGFAVALPGLDPVAHFKAIADMYGRKTCPANWRPLGLTLLLGFMSSKCRPCEHFVLSEWTRAWQLTRVPQSDYADMFDAVPTNARQGRYHAIRDAVVALDNIHQCCFTNVTCAKPPTRRTYPHLVTSHTVDTIPRVVTFRSVRHAHQQDRRDVVFTGAFQPLDGDFYLDSVVTDAPHTSGQAIGVTV